jgi:hypothetical protein
VLEIVRKELEKDLALCNQLQLGLAHWTVLWCTGQCPVVHRTVFGAPGWSPVKMPLSGFDGGIRL